MLLRVGRLAGGVSLVAFGFSLLCRGLGLAIYEIGWLVLRAGLHSLWSILQFNIFFTGVPRPLGRMATVAGGVGLAAFAAQWITAGVSLCRYGWRSVGLGALALAAVWFALVAPEYRGPLPHVILLLTGLGALALGVGWFTLDEAASQSPREAGARARPISLSRPAWAWVAVAALAPALAACQVTLPAAAGRHPYPPGSYMAQIQKRGTIVIGVKFDLPRFGLLNPATNEPEGFDVALGELIAQRLGVRPKFVEAITRDRISLLVNNKVDLVIATMTITEERRQQIDFSTPYYLGHQRLLVRRGSKITDVTSLDAENAKVCSTAGSTSAQNIEGLVRSDLTVLVDTFSRCLGLLENGRVQAVTTDDVILEGLRIRDPKGLTVVGGSISDQPYGIGIKKGHPEFVNFVNDCISQDGILGRLNDTWIKPLYGDSNQPHWAP
jgi:ABC-type amino acid transport substrate-binding protein